jgi:hypothetical protein
MADAKPPACAACGQQLSLGRGWVRDDQDRPVHLKCSEPLPCPMCSKPVAGTAGVPVNGRMTHIGCVARESELPALREIDRTRQGIARSRRLIERTRDAVQRAKLRTWTCVVCGHSLRVGGGLLFQGDELVHAACWRAPEVQGPPSPPASE